MDHSSASPTTSRPASLSASSELVRRHQLFGWWSLLVFLSLGLILETLHGFKVPAYVHLANETRRHMWTLAHAHGTLLALVNLLFAFTASRQTSSPPQRLRWASPCLLSAGVLMPTGFFFGGLVIYQGDPGLGIFLVPAGGALLWLGILFTALQVSARPEPDPAQGSETKPKTSQETDVHGS